MTPEAASQAINGCAAQPSPKTVRAHPKSCSPFTQITRKRIEPLIPERKSRAKGGRPPEDDRKMFTAIVYVLRTGIQWNALPRERGASTTVSDRFRLWEEQGFFTQLWQNGLQEYDELVGLDWEWQSVDGVMTKAPDRAETRPDLIRPIAEKREPNAVNYVRDMDYPWPLQ
jgi:transposase